MPIPHDSSVVHSEIASVSTPTFFFCKNVLTIITFTHHGILPPKIATTLFNDSNERGDYEIRNDEFIRFFYGLSIYFCITSVVTHLTLCENGLVFGKDSKSL